MRLELYNYRFAQEILESSRHDPAWQELTEVFSKIPVFIFPGKSKKNERLDIVQQVMNTYLDRRLAVDLGWDYHPTATRIPDSGLAADFRKTYGDLVVQMEVQFGNMSRWYSDIFKFQTAYSQSLTRVAVSVVPMQEMAVRIDSNIVNFERTKRELPSADLSITLPILMVGLGFNANTEFVDLSKTRFLIEEITGRGRADNRWRIVHGYINGTSLKNIGPESETGPMPADTGGVAGDGESKEDAEAD